MYTKWLAIILFLVRFTGLSASDISSDLVGWWPLDGIQSQSVLDSSSTQQHGSLVGKPHCDKGIFGNALLFNGSDDYVNCRTNPAFNFSKQMTISLWIKPRTTGGTLRTMIGKTKEFRLSWNGQTSRLRFTANPSRRDMWEIQSNSKINKEQWHHVVGVYNLSAFKLYIDGKLDNSISEIPSIHFANSPLLIGNYDIFLGRYFWNGWIDEVRVYQRALADVEIDLLYQWGDIYAMTDARMKYESEKTINHIEDRLVKHGGWQNNINRKELQDSGIAQAQLVLAQIYNINGGSPNKAEDLYSEIMDLFPESGSASSALYELVKLNPNRGWKYADLLQGKDHTNRQVVRLYTRLVQDYFTASNFQASEQLLLRFINQYLEDPDAMQWFAQVAQSLKFDKDLYIILDRCSVKYPNSGLCCAIFKYLTEQLTKAQKHDQLIALCNGYNTNYPETRLASCANTILIETHFRLGNHVTALETADSQLFSSSQSSTDVINNINKLLDKYNIETMQFEDIILDQVFENLARHTHKIGMYDVAIHLYQRAIVLTCLDLDTFEIRTDSRNRTTQQIISEVYFWRGLLNSERGNLAEAAIAYEIFIEKSNDKTSSMAARAFYDIARAHMVLGQYQDAEQALAKAKSIRKCRPIRELDWKLQRLLNPLTIDHY